MLLEMENLTDSVCPVIEGLENSKKRECLSQSSTERVFQILL